jgi:hypothetical protein
MKGRHRKSRYQVISFFQELILFFISSFLYFPSHIRRIILCFVYSDDHQPTVVYPSLKEEDLSSSCIIDFDHFPLSKPCENDVCIQIPPEIDHPYSHVDYKVDFPLANSVISCNQPIVPGDHPTNVQSRIREKNFKPLKLPSTLHPYPPKFLEYLPLFIGEDHIIAEKHLRSFQNFIDNLEIMHEDVVMRLFSKSLVGDVALWFKNLEVGSIGSWDELYGAFSRYWGGNKSFDQYLTEFYALRREKDEVLATFNKRFYSFICSMPLGSDLLKLLP